METAFDTAVARTLAAFGGVLIVIAITMTVAAFRPAPELAPSTRLAVRAGFATLLASMVFGGIMIARGVVQVVTGNQQLAYTVATALKPAHAVLMHGVLLLPALSWLLSRALPSEELRLRAVRVATWSYVAVAAFVSGLAVGGVTVVGPSTASVLSAGAISGLAIVAIALGRVDPRLIQRKP
jgi:hypothetical protein